jgi:DNA-binding IclR family transcriptional regulator
VAAIHVAASLSEWTEESFRQRAGPLVMEAARALSHTYKRG